MVSSQVGFLKNVLILLGFSVTFVTKPVTSHLMNGVMNSVEVESLCALCKVGLSCGCAVLGFNAHFKILLGGIGDDLAEKLREL